MARVGDGGPAVAPAARRGNFLGRASIQDPFAILGLKQSASSEQITCAYRSLARRYHPDKDRSVPSHLATARFQRIRAAYDLLSDERKRKAAAASSISAPFKPSAAWRAQQRRAAGHAGPAPPRKKVKPMRFKAPRKKKIKPQNPPAAEEEKELPKEAKKVDVVEILDSDDEACPVEAAPPAAVLLPRRRAPVRAAEGDDCRRLQSRAAAKRRALERRQGEAKGEEPSAVEEPEEAAGNSFARLVFRSGKGRIVEILAEDLLTAFPGAEVVLLEPCLAVLSFPTQKQAVACALSFHGWPGRAPPERELRVLRQLSLVVAPVDSNGCAQPGPKTLVVSRTRVAAADGRELCLDSVTSSNDAAQEG
ncbi:dnaJ [Symbiodinium sp. CCMP2592]|nr:dnaJ [Symbiodinium sp. CCMP2592]